MDGAMVGEGSRRREGVGCGLPVVEPPGVQTPVSLVAVWTAGPLFIQVTVSPTCTFSVAG